MPVKSERLGNVIALTQQIYENKVEPRKQAIFFPLITYVKKPYFEIGQG